ncbi:MAG: hypothetical protein ACREP7_00990 [Lysobacter sp.]
MAQPLRHHDTGKWLGSFADHVEVVCPRCGRAGEVRTEHRWVASFVCAQCQLDARSERNDWLGKIRLSGRRPCGYCGYQWLQVNRLEPGGRTVSIQLEPRRLTPWGDTLPVRCPICKHSSDVILQASRQRDDEGLDPHFGMPLRLTERTRAGLLWVYNPGHIDELRRYIAADQRERRCTMSNKTMVSSLPTWMKLARHRAMMLKALDRLAARLTEPRER